MLGSKVSATWLRDDNVHDGQEVVEHNDVDALDRDVHNIHDVNNVHDVNNIHDIHHVHDHRLHHVHDHRLHHDIHSANHVHHDIHLHNDPSRSDSGRRAGDVGSSLR
jgi:hypothetical protein